MRTLTTNAEHYPEKACAPVLDTAMKRLATRAQACDEAQAQFTDCYFPRRKDRAVAGTR